MIHFSLFTVLFLLAHASGLQTEPWSPFVEHRRRWLTGGRRGKAFPMSGFTFTSERYCGNVTMNSPRAQQSLAHLATTGANYVAIVVTMYQLNVNSTSIFPVPTPIKCTATPTGSCFTTSDKDLIATIRHAKALGLSVMLKPHIDLIDDEKHWRGDIGRYKNDTERDKAHWVAWFTHYYRFIVHYAKIAEREGCEMFSVSTELIYASRQDFYWRNLIVPAVRAVYSGIVTDAANWSPPGPDSWGELVEKTWWDVVDIIGVDEYWMPSFLNDTYLNKEQLLELWKQIEEQLEGLHKMYNKPVLFTEIGFCSGINGTCYHNGQPAPNPPTDASSLAAQAVQFDAVMTAMSKHDWILGFFWWNWAADDAFGGEDDTCMDIKFKPAEEVLRRWYAATEKAPPRPKHPPVCKCWL